MEITMEQIKLWKENDPAEIELHCHKITDFLLSEIDSLQLECSALDKELGRAIQDVRNLEEVIDEIQNKR